MAECGNHHGAVAVLPLPGHHTSSVNRKCWSNKVTGQRVRCLSSGLLLPPVPRAAIIRQLARKAVPALCLLARCNCGEITRFDDRAGCRPASARMVKHRSMATAGLRASCLMPHCSPALLKFPPNTACIAALYRSCGSAGVPIQETASRS